MRRVLIAASVLAALLRPSAMTIVAQDQSPATIRSMYAAALAAYDKKNYPEYLRLLIDVSALRRTHPTITWRLAGAYALNGRAEDAAAVLRRLEKLTLYNDVAGSKDFADVRTNPAIQSAVQALDAIKTRRIGASEPAWTIHQKTFVPEGVAYDAVTKTFFVSSQFQRKIVRIDATGNVSDFADRSSGLWMVFGMVVDPERRLLWAVSTAERPMDGYTAADENRTGIFAFNIDTAKLAHRYLLDPSTPPHRFDDVTVGRDGRVFASDGGTGAIYTAAPNGELREFLRGGTIQGPNGIAPSPDGRFVYVSDYAGYIFKIDTTTAAAMRLEMPEDVALYGIDGLAWDKDGLIGVQNGVNPERVIRLALNDNHTRIANVTILDMGNAHVAEPTLGVVVGDSYYYVANSHGALLRKPNSVLSEQALTEPVILKLQLR